MQSYRDKIFRKYFKESLNNRWTKHIEYRDNMNKFLKQIY